MAQKVMSQSSIKPGNLSDAKVDVDVQFQITKSQSSIKPGNLSDSTAFVLAANDGHVRSQSSIKPGNLSDSKPRPRKSRSDSKSQSSIKPGNLSDVTFSHWNSEVVTQSQSSIKPGNLSDLILPSPPNLLQRRLNPVSSLVIFPTK